METIIKSCHFLQKLSLKYLEINEEIMKSIIQQNCLTLEILDLSGCTGITYESIQNISQLNNLTEINFSWTKSLIFHFNSEIIQYLVNNLPINLKKLSLRGQKMVQDEDVLCLVKRCKNINLATFALIGNFCYICSKYSHCTFGCYK